MHLYSGYTRVSQQQTTNATEHLMEFNFLLAEPTDILIHPTNHFGPDVVGFLFKSDNKKDRVLLVASQSFYSSHSPVKQAKNQKIGLNIGILVIEPALILSQALYSKICCLPEEFKLILHFQTAMITSWSTNKLERKS
jgi:hypothetical protein